MVAGLLLCLLVLGYWAVLEYLRNQWRSIPAPVNKELPLSPGVKISLIVVVRNEAKNLPQLFKALQAQTLSPDNFELHLVDDASTDGSWQLAENFRLQAAFSMRLHKLQQYAAGASPKKAAISQVMPQARGGIIVVTDGDCQPEAPWLMQILAHWHEGKTVFISGPVCFMEEQNFFERMQAMDFAALIGVGAAMLQAGKPGMCNAANMAFSKEAFLAVGGYAGNSHIPSGDDEFLLQKLAACYPGQIKFMKHAGALVSTHACRSWQHFVQQRKRWAGKWRMHQGWGTVLLAGGVFFFYLALITALVFPFLLPESSTLVLPALLIKGVADYRFLSPIFNFLKKPLSPKVFLFVELVYPFYVLFFAVAANWGSFTWKERTYRYTAAAHD